MLLGSLGLMNFMTKLLSSMMAIDFSSKLPFINYLSRKVKSGSLNSSLTTKSDLFTLEVIVFGEIIRGHSATVISHLH